MAEQKSPEAAAGPRPMQAIDESRMEPFYSNFFRVTNTAEEVVIDLGLNTATAETQHIPVVLEKRLVLNHYTAKRLFQALGITLERHEKSFGVIETNIQRRVLPQPKS
ncbi:MAG: DUF3467 domain-containing protein [Pirellula sp.]|nr:DUF3467 domain-containing protein [Pirellula sp.]